MVMKFGMWHGSHPIARDILPALQEEFASEGAASLGAAYKDLEKALAQVAALPSKAEGDAQHLAREQTLDAAAEALWCFVVQREACGFRNTDAVLKDLNVPQVLRARMGVRRTRRATDRFD